MPDRTPDREEKRPHPGGSYGGGATPAPPIPELLQSYLARSGYWAGKADYDFWYAISAEEWYWMHLRRQGTMLLAVTLFASDDTIVDLDIYNLSRAPVHGLRATIVNTPLMTVERFDPPLPQVAIQLRDGRRQHFTLPRQPETLADQWLGEALGKVQQALVPTWQLLHATIEMGPHEMLQLWPVWAGPPPEPR